MPTKFNNAPIYKVDVPGEQLPTVVSRENSTQPLTSCSSPETNPRQMLPLPTSIMLPAAGIQLRSQVQHCCMIGEDDNEEKEQVQGLELCRVRDEPEDSINKTENELIPAIPMSTRADPGRGRAMSGACTGLSTERKYYIKNEDKSEGKSSD